MRPRLFAAALAVVAPVAGTVPLAEAQPVRLSVATDGTAANNNSFLPAMSETGRFVTFLSFADNLVAGDTNGFEDVFLRDRDTDADGVFDEPGAVSTVRVSQRGAIQGNGPSHDSAITPDGRFVVFTSFASNLFSSGLPQLAASVVLRWDRLTGDIALVSQTTAGEPLLAARSVQPDVSDDGNTVVFVYGGSLATEAEQGYRGIVLRRDIAAGTLTAVSTLPLVDEPGRVAFNESPSITGDGRTIAYAVVQKERAPGNPPIYIVQTGTVHLVDAATGAVRRSLPGVHPVLTRDGAYLAFVEPVGLSTLGVLARVHVASGERLSTGSVGTSWEPLGAISLSGRYFAFQTEVADYRYGSFLFSRAVDRTAFDAVDRWAAYAERSQASNSDPAQVVAADLATLFDSDGDGLNDHWEALFGLGIDPGTGGNAGNSGAAGDPDGDGFTNAQEFAAGSHPTGMQPRFLAEGASGSFYTTRYAVANPSELQANVSLRLDLDGGGYVTRTFWVPGGTRVVHDSRTLGVGTASFSAVVESTLPVAVDRLMTWGASGVIYGSHAETASAAPNTLWFFAEGSTVLGFQLFYLLQNPQTTPTTATIRYLLPSGAPIVRTYQLPARSRTTIVVNDVPGLSSTDVSAEITAMQPIAAERAMYRSTADQPFALGHAGGAVRAPGITWLFGEGATGSFFDTYLLLANPSSQPASVDVSYLRDAGGPVTATYIVPANSRFSVFVDSVPGVEQAAFGMRVTSDVPVVAERAMYWSGGFFDYYEGHVSAGVYQPARHWLLAEGEQGGIYDAQTFVLVANVGTIPLNVRLRSLPRPWGTAASMNVTLAAGARVTVPLASLPGYQGGAIDVSQPSGDPPGLVVEGAIYWDAGPQVFAAGANWLATPMP